MLLTITTTYLPATDLGYLLHKNPSRVQTFNLAFGQAHVFYPDVSAERCTAALLLDVDPVGLVRRDGQRGIALQDYINDRPYTSSSLLSVAIAQVFGSALNGNSRERPELVTTAIPLEATVASLSSRGSERLIHRLFEPLGYDISVQDSILDPDYPDWGRSPYFNVKLSRVCPLQELLAHLYVMIPVLDDMKHYYVGEDEIQKLLRHGDGWLASHPEHALITRRYLKHQRSLTRDALARLLDNGTPEQEAVDETPDGESDEGARVGLHQQRLDVVLEVLRSHGVRRVLDLGCGEGKLLRRLIKEPQFQSIVGMDVSHRALEVAADRLNLDQLNPRQRARIQLIHGSLMYRDPRLTGFDAAAVVEVVEHLDPPRLKAFERVLFEFARPTVIVLTTPNAEYNVKWESLAKGALRHGDHRFEWTREEFAAWTQRMCKRFGYRVQHHPIGDVDPIVGAPTQMAVFELGPS